MFSEAINQIRIATLLIIFFTILTGLIYPAAVSTVAQLVFPWQANGSLISNNGNTVGSMLIGQSFTEDKYFWGRPSATTPFPYNGESSSGSNMGPSNPAFLDTVKSRVNSLRQLEHDNDTLIPVDLVTASGSGLDFEISPLAAAFQVKRIAVVRQIPEADIQALIDKHSQKRTFGILGEPRVNVLQLNLALDNKRN